MTRMAQATTAAWIARHVPNRGTRSSAVLGGAVSGIWREPGSARASHYATISP